MQLDQFHSYLVHPEKAPGSRAAIGGTAVPNGGQLHGMLSDIFERAPRECDIEIVFRPDEDGTQTNPCRDLLASHVAGPTLKSGRLIAERLQSATTNRSGLGLLFIMTGGSGTRRRIVISRFPTDQGVVAEETSGSLSVEFLERVFMKSAKSYKSAFYESESIARGFWDGRAVDRQISGPREVSDYWIRGFLLSELRTTGPAGTKRLAVAVRDATRTTSDLAVRQELVAAASVLRGQDGRSVTGRRLIASLALSDAAASAIADHMPRPELLDETFQFDGEEFDRHIRYRLVELDNGGMLLADAETFSEVFAREVVDSDESLVRYTTEGHIVDDRLRSSR